MRAAVLGGTGEIGSKLLTYLKAIPDLSLIATYHSCYVADDGDIKWMKCNIQNENDFREIADMVDVIVNCAGASYLTGERVAKIAGEYGKIYVDPFGGNYLMEKLRPYEKNAEFILSSPDFAISESSDLLVPSSVISPLSSFASSPTTSVSESLCSDSSTTDSSVVVTFSICTASSE